MAATPATPVPADIRWMNALATLLFAGVTAIVLAAALAAAARARLFDIRAIRVEGEVTRNSVATIRANALPRLSGNFFTLDLAAAQRAFEAVPWVRRAVVRRLWPNRLAVRLEEHRAAAYWQPEDEGEKLVNTEGEVFEANLGDVEDDATLPGFEGPEGTSAEMLALYRRLSPAIARLDARIETLKLSGRGSWRAELDSGAAIELGRGSEDELLGRTDRFVRTVAQVTERYAPRPLEYADLRHADGYAVRLKGVSTTTAVAAAPAKGGSARRQN